MASSNMSQGQVITYAQDEVINVFEQLMTFTDASQQYTPDAGSMQRSSEQYWKPVQQAVETIDGWDIEGEETGLLELSIGGSLDEPNNVYKKLRVDDLRDETSLRRQMRAAAMGLGATMEQRGLAKAATHGALCIASSQAYGPGSLQKPVWDAIAEAESRMFSAEMDVTRGSCAFLNSNTYRAGGKFLVESSANFGNSVPEDAYMKGEIQKQIAGIGDVYRHNKTPRITGQAASVTVANTVSILPEANELLANGSRGNVDNRFGVITVSDGSALNIGDKFEFDGVKAVTLGSAKKVLDYNQTYTIAAINGNDLTISPRPMAVQDPLMVKEKAPYANIDAQIQSGAALVFLNTTSVDTNIIMAKDSMVIASQPIPYNHDMFQGLDAEAFSVGPINGMIGFESSLGKLTGMMRLAVWYDWQVEKPEACGIIIPSQA